MNKSSRIGNVFWAKICTASFLDMQVFCWVILRIWDLESSINTTFFDPGRCSIRTKRTRIKKWMNNPYKIQISMNLMLDVCGSFEEMELLRVYMTNMAVIATGMLVLKCSALKYRVTCKKISVRTIQWQTFSFLFVFLFHLHDKNLHDIIHINS